MNGYIMCHQFHLIIAFCFDIKDLKNGDDAVIKLISSLMSVAVDSHGCCCCMMVALDLHVPGDVALVADVVTVVDFVFVIATGLLQLFFFLLLILLLLF